MEENQHDEVEQLSTPAKSQLVVGRSSTTLNTTYSTTTSVIMEGTGFTFVEWLEHVILSGLWALWEMYCMRRPRHRVEASVRGCLFFDLSVLDDGSLSRMNLKIDHV